MREHYQNTWMLWNKKTKEVDKPEPQPTNIERIIEKPAQVIKDAPYYDNIPPEDIEQLIKKRHSSVKDNGM